jgi:transposase-like protein
MTLDHYERGFPVDWRRVKADYIAGGTSYRKLADKYGVSFNTLKKRATEEQWYELRQQKDHNVTTRLVNVVSEKEIQKAVDIIDVADKLLAKATELMEMPLTTQSFKQLTSALKDLKEIKGYKTDADIREQEARIKKLEAEINGENRDTTITVEIKGNAEDWGN